MIKEITDSSLGKFGSIISEWEELLKSSYDGILSSDYTNSSTWAQAICDTFLENNAKGILSIISKDKKIVGLLPYARENIWKWHTPIRRLQSMSSYYLGRHSFIVENNNTEYSTSLLLAALNEIPSWDTFKLTILCNSTAHRAFFKLAKESTILANVIGSSQSPYILLSDNWNETFDLMPKKLRWTIRKNCRELSAIGSLEYKEFGNQDNIDELFKIILEVERNSWKDNSGSSIIAQKEQLKFYKSLAMHSFNNNSISAHVLLLNNKPLAYIFGIISGDGSFLDLKESFVESYSKYSPAHVLKGFALPALIRKGIRIYDFMGECEPYKMRWTDKKYQRFTVVIYNKTVFGILAYIKSILSKKGTPLQAPISTGLT